MLYNLSFLLLFSMLLPVLSACSSDTGSGPKDVKWDRDSCERCRMVLSDRHSSVQVRYQPPDKKRSKVVLFDDLGCAVLWLQDKPWKNDPQTEIWVTDHQTGDWINARQATYIPGKLTPMEYGLGAQLDWEEGGLSFEQAKAHVVQVEKRFNAHGVHLLDKYRQQADRRNGQLYEDDSSLPPIVPLKE